MGIAFTLLSFVVSYFLLRKHLTPESFKSYLKLALITLPIGILLFFLVFHFLIYDDPTPFKEAIELLSNDTLVQKNIGDFDSYTYRKEKLPKESDNPATVNVALSGTYATIYITCVVKKDSSGKWTISSIKEDSLIKK